MSGLTDEQRRRMEENRQRALYKRRMRHKQTVTAPANAARHSNLTHTTGSLNVASNAAIIKDPNMSKSAHPSGLSSTSAHYSDLSNQSTSPQNSCTDKNMKQISSNLVKQQLQSSNTLNTSNNTFPKITNVSHSVAGTSNYTSDEARRMEENRRKALEKRAANKNNASASPCSAVSRNSSIESQLPGNVNFYASGQPKPFSDSSRPDKPSVASGSSNESGSHAGVSKRGTIPSQVESKSEASPSGSAQAVKPVFGKTVNGTFRLISTERFTVDAGFSSQMVEVFKTMDNKVYDSTTCSWTFNVCDHDKLVSALAPMRPAVCISPLPTYVCKVLKSLTRQIPAACVDLFGLDPRLLEALMPFQHDGVCFGVSRGGRVMFADDMGLGKTIQALGVASHYRSEWPLLVVTPSSLRYAWVSAIERWVSSVDRSEIVVVGSCKDYFKDAAVVIMSYDVLTRRASEVLDHGFKVIILDESHMIKNFKAARYKAVAPLMKRARRVILLTGTPALSRPSELYTQITGIDSTIFPSFQEFGVRYCNGKQLPWGWDFSGFSNMQELQILLEAKFMIRRLKSQVLDQLPAKQRMTIILDPNSVEASTMAMEEAAKRLGLRTLKGADRQTALLQFFSHTAHAKLKAVSEYIKEMLESEKKFLVFAHHKVMMDKLCEVCENAKVRYIRIEGKTSGELRQNLTTKFQTDDDVKVAVLSITAANTGLTLTAAQLVIFAELFWNPGALMQAEDRAHRIGQQDCVVVQYLIARGTADDYIWPLIREKLFVLSKAGLSKDDFSETVSKYQKNSQKESILQYLRDIQDEETLDQSPVKKQRT